MPQTMTLDEKIDTAHKAVLLSKDGDEEGFSRTNNVCLGIGSGQEEKIKIPLD